MLYLPCCSPTVVRRQYFYKWCNEPVISGCFLSIIASDGDRTVQLAACVEKQTTVHELRALGLYQDWGTRESPSGFFLAWALFHLRLWSSSTLRQISSRDKFHPSLVIIHCSLGITHCQHVYILCLTGNNAVVSHLPWFKTEITSHKTRAANNGRLLQRRTILGKWQHIE